MDVRDALRARRMTRAFDGTALDEDEVVELCTEALRAPTAGNVRGVELVVLAGRDGTRRYLEAATDPEWRATSTRALGFAGAGAAVVVVCDPSAYADRYGEDDKAGDGLDDVDRWPVPYWHADAAFATMALLLLAEDQGIAACFLGAFRHDREVLRLVRAPERFELFGAVLLGQAADVQSPSASLARPGPSRAARVRRGRFPSTA